MKVVDGTATYYSYNAANELLTEATGAETTYYHYDGSGNTVAKQVRAAHAEGTAATQHEKGRSTCQPAGGAKLRSRRG